MFADDRCGAGDLGSCKRCAVFKPVRKIGNFDDFTASKNSIALSINGCSTKSAGALTLVDGAFPAIAAEKNLAIRYKAKVSASEAVTNINAATVIFTIAAVNEKEAA